MAFCSACGAGIDDGADSCGACGASLAGGGSADRPTSMPTVATPNFASGSGAGGSGGVPADPDILEPGHVVAGRYRILDRLGAGGMGVVFKVLDLEINEIVALKLLAPGISGDATMIERFKQEMALARKIAHPNICRIFDLGEDGGRYFITMQYVDGDSLSSLMRRIGPLAGSRIRTLLEQICRGLSAAHREGVVHNDLKPANIMIDQQGNAVIMDFGLAHSPQLPLGLAPGGVVGTPGYMSPEQARGESTDSRSDVYALGCVAYELLAGESAFAGNTVQQLMEHQRSGTIKPLVRRGDDAEDGELEQVIEICVRPKPGERFADAAAMLAALGSGVSDTDLDPSGGAAGVSDLFSGRTAAWGLVALLALMLAYPVHRHVTAVGRIEIEHGRDAAIGKARDLVRELGHEARGLGARARVLETSFNRLCAVDAGGREELDRAFAAGEAFGWSVNFDGSDGALQKLSAGEFRVDFALDGRLVEFETPVVAESEAETLSEAAAVELASGLVRDRFAIDPSAYRLAVNRDLRPGVITIEWQRPERLLGHDETLRVVLQGETVHALSRKLTPPDSWTNREVGVQRWSRKIRFFVGGAAAVGLVAMFGFGVITVVRWNRWRDIVRPVPVIAAVVGALALIAQQVTQRGGFIRQDIVIMPVMFLISTLVAMPSLAGLLSWFRRRSPERMRALDQLERGRASAPAAVSVVAGVIIAALATALGNLSHLARLPFPGSPDFGFSPVIVGHPFPTLQILIWAVVIALFISTVYAALLECAEWLLGRGWRSLTLAALTLSFGALFPAGMLYSSWGQALAVSALTLVAVLPASMLLLWTYRRFGLAAAFVGGFAGTLLDFSVELIGTRQASGPTTGFIMIAIVVLLLLFGLAMAVSLRSKALPA